MDDEDSPLLTPEEPVEVVASARAAVAVASESRGGDSPLLTPEEPVEVVASARVAVAVASESCGGSNGSGHAPSGCCKRERPSPEDAPAPTTGSQAAAAAAAASVVSVCGTDSAADKYRRIEKVGVGAYGNVYRAERLETKETVAIKVASRKEDPVLGGFPLSLLREIAILRRVRHENIVQIHEVVQTSSGEPLIVMEFCQASLLELMHSKKHELSFSEIKYISRQLLDATGHLHTHGILHRDLATKNVLFNLSGEIKVCDFGISRVAFGEDEEFGYLPAGDLENPNQIVSLPYRAIELLLGDPKYGPALDIWSVGCILAEVMLCQAGRRQPFFGGDLENPNKKPQMFVEEIFQILGRPTDETWPGFSKLPLLRSFANAPRVVSAMPHHEQGEERTFLRRFFTTGEGKPAHTKYCLTESCFDLLGRIFTLCPAHRTTASEALQHSFFTSEKPVPEWHAWHWALDKSEILRGEKMRRQDRDDDGTDTRKLLKQLSQEEMKATEGAATNSKEVVERWRQEAERRQAEERRSSGDRRTKEKGMAAGPNEGSNGGSLPPGWTKHWSASKQRFYYHDNKSRQNLWELPTR